MRSGMVPDTYPICLARPTLRRTACMDAVETEHPCTSLLLQSPTGCAAFPDARAVRTFTEKDITSIVAGDSCAVECPPPLCFILVELGTVKHDGYHLDRFVSRTGEQGRQQEEVLGKALK